MKRGCVAADAAARCLYNAATEFLPESHAKAGCNSANRVAIVVEAVGAPELALTLPTCLAGENACPPEDVGGVSGYAEVRDALANPKHDQHIDYRTWVGGVFDPTGFDVNAVNA